MYSTTRLSTSSFDPRLDSSELDYHLFANVCPADITATTLLSKDMLVDFVGRTENLQEHFEMALLAAGNNATVSAACAASLPHDDHGSEHGPYADYYTDPMRHAPWFEIDARVFNYTFNMAAPTDIILQRGVHDRRQPSDKSQSSGSSVCTAGTWGAPVWNDTNVPKIQPQWPGRVKL